MLSSPLRDIKKGITRRRRGRGEEILPAGSTSSTRNCSQGSATLGMGETPMVRTMAILAMPHVASGFHFTDPQLIAGLGNARHGRDAHGTDSSSPEEPRSSNEL